MESSRFKEMGNGEVERGNIAKRVISKVDASRNILYYFPYLHKMVFLLSSSGFWKPCSAPHPTPPLTIVTRFYIPHPPFIPPGIPPQHHRTDRALKLANASGLCRPL